MSAALIFRVKATLLQLNRAARDVLNHEVTRFPIRHTLFDKATVAQSKTRLWTESDEAEKYLMAGKAHNLRLALRRLNGVEVPAGAVFSFWAQIGRTSRRKGYVAGRELREGCLIPTIGGGLCQLSNALYDAALHADFEIVERHAHTQVVPGSLAEMGRDATVFWNYVDLRFKSPQPFRIEATMDADFLTVRLKSETSRRSVQQVQRSPERAALVAASNAPQSCTSCSVYDCFRHVEDKPSITSFGRAAYLVDEFSPEFDAYISATQREQDLLAIPLDGKRFRKANYSWSTEGFRRVRQRWIVTLLRAYRSRKLALQGASAAHISREIGR